MGWGQGPGMTEWIMGGHVGPASFLRVPAGFGIGEMCRFKS